MPQTLGTVLVVTLVTVLVWAFAEAESLTSRAVPVQAVFSSGEAGMFLIEPVGGGGNLRIDATLEGSTSAVISAASAFEREPVVFAPGVEGIPAEEGRFTIDVRAVLRGQSKIPVRGISFLRVAPEEIAVEITRLVTRELKIEADVGGQELDGAAVVRPASVKITLPASEASRLEPGAVARAKVSADALSKLVSGRREVVGNVPVELPVALARAALSVSRVEVSLTLRTKTETVVLPSVPVYVSLAAMELGRWDVLVREEDRFLTDVEVSGPSELVDQVRRGQVRVIGYVVLTFDDLERGVGSKNVSFGEVPTALTFKANSSTVRLKIVRRAAVPRE